MTIVSDTVVVRNAEVSGERMDVRIHDGTIVAIEPPTGRRTGADEIDAAGGALICGLHDHHIHLMALAAARNSLVVDPTFEADLRTAAAMSGTGTWIRAVGYHESVTGHLDRHWLDAVAPENPVRVQHRSGAMWVLNSLALAAVGVESTTGQLFGMDELLRSRIPGTVLDLDGIGRELAGYGVTGVTDLTPTTSMSDVERLADLVTGAGFPVDVMVTGAPHLPSHVDIGIAFGPAKIVVRDDELPTIDDLVASFLVARRHGRSVAVHCVTRIGLVLALAAWREVGAKTGDRIEHAAVVPSEMLAELRTMGLTVVTQPSFVCERGDTYLAEVDAQDLDGLWRCGSLLNAGISVGASTDAPYGSADPWHSIATAAKRLTSSGVPIGPDERISPERALMMFQSDATDPGGPARSVALGRVARLCLLDSPLSEVLRAPSSRHVVGTVGRAGFSLRAEPER
jgi:predicted amidohydrolase YtcJ